MLPLYQRVNQKSRYQVIKGLVQEFQRLPAEVRQREPLWQYIMLRSQLSRSSIMNMLSELKKEVILTFKMAD